MPEKVSIDKSGTNTAALEGLNQEQKVAGEPEIQIRQIKYLNNLVEQDHRGIKRRTKPIFPYKAQSVALRFSERTKRLGFLELRFHSSRHEGISRLFEQKMSIPEVALRSAIKPGSICGAILISCTKNHRIYGGSARE